MRAVVINPGTHPEPAHAAAALARAGYLHKYFTGSAVSEREVQVSTRLASRHEQRITAALGQRVLPADVASHQVSRHGVGYEVGRLFARRYARFAYERLLQRRSRAVDLAAANEIERSRLHVVLGQASGCENAFESARERGVLSILNYSIMHHRGLLDLLEAEGRENPAWRFSMPELNIDYDESRRDREIETADHILVGSGSVKESFVHAGIQACKLTVIPYAAPTFKVPFPINPTPVITKHTVRFLYVGQLTQRKGVFHLLEAFRNSSILKTATLTIVGPSVNGSLEYARTEYDQNNIEFVGPLSHDEIAAYYARSDVFVLPSLAEGFPLSALEAMRFGLPVIATPCVLGGVLPLEAAVVVPPSSMLDLQQAIEFLASDPEARKTFGDQGRASTQALTWETYEHRLLSFIRHQLESQTGK